MNARFRLYVGLVRNGTWYNFTHVTEIRGGALAVLDGANRSGAARLFNLVKGSVQKLMTEDGMEYELQEKDFFDLKIDDCWRIALECMKQFTGHERPVFEEYFFCHVCSNPGLERYTKVEESWFDLIEKGFIDEHYFDDANCSWVTELPRGIEIEGNRQLAGGTFTKIKREPLTLGDMIKLQGIPAVMASETGMIHAIWDAQIKEIEGMTERDLNVYVKRNPKESFCKKYLIHQEDIMAMSEQAPKIGLDAGFRPVQCEYCHSPIGGYLDFTNFFDFLFPKRSSQELEKVT